MVDILLLFPCPMVAATLTSLCASVDVTVTLRDSHTGEEVLRAESQWPGVNQHPYREILPSLLT